MGSEVTIDQLQIEVETKADGAIQGLKKLKSTLKSLDKLGTSNGLDKVCDKLQRIANIRFDNLNKLNALGDTMRRVEQLSKKVDNLSSSLSDVPNSVDVGVDASGMTEAVNTTGQLDDAIQHIPKSTHVDVNTAGMDDAEHKTSRFGRAMNTVRSAASKASAGIRSVSSRLREASSSFGKTTKKASQLSQILRIVVLYGGAFRLFSMLTQGVSEGLKNVAKYNKETATAMNRLSTMSLHLKNSIGAALYPVIVALTPALQTMANAVIKAFEAMGQLVSLLSGKTTYLKAKEYLKEYGDTASQTANKIKKSFAGMDEITVIGNKDGGSSSGDNYGDMFEESPIDNPHVQALVPFFRGLGIVLGSCFNKIKELANDYLYPWLVKLGEWCDENPETLEKIGAGLGTIAVALVAMKGASAVITPLATFFEKVGGAKKGIGILGTVAGAVVQLMGAFDAWENGMTWESLGEQLTGIGIAIGSMALSVGHIGVGIASIVGGIVLVVTSVRDWLENGTSWENFLGVMIGLAAVFGGISVLVGSWIPMAIGAVVATVMAIVMWWEEISTFFVNLWNSIIGFFKSIGQAVGNFFGGIASWVNDKILQPIIQFFKPFVEAIVGFFQAIWSVVSTIFSAIWYAISSVFTAIWEVIVHIATIIGEIVVGIGEAIWSVVVKIWEIISTVAQAIWAVISWLFSLIWDFISGIATWVYDKAIMPVVNFFRDLATRIVECLTNIVNKIKERVVDPVVNFFRNMIDKIVGFFKNVGIKVSDAIAGAFKSVMNGAFTVVESVVNFFIKGLNGALDIINKIPGVNIKRVELLHIPRFATGGFPEDGMFMANHGELVGKFSNGKTAVANNEQIVAGISDGVYAANQEQNGLLREQNNLLRQLVEKQSNGQIDVTTITSAMLRKNRRDGKTVVPVGI